MHEPFYVFRRFRSPLQYDLRHPCPEPVEGIGKIAYSIGITMGDVA